MRRLITLTLLSNLLIINDVLAEESAVEACQAALAQGRYPQAISMAEKSASLPSAWLCKGRAQVASHQLEAAEQSFQQALQLKPSAIERVSAHMFLGNTLREKHQVTQALQQYQTAEQLSQEAGLKRYEMIAVNLKGEAMYEGGDFQHALEAFQHGEKMAMNDNERADSFEHEAMVYERLQLLDKAVEFQLKAVMMQKKSGTPDQYAEASLTLGKLFTTQKDYASAEKTYQRLMEYARDNGGPFYEAKSAIHLAQLKKLQGDQAGATQWLKQAEAIAAKLKDAELDQLIAQTRS